MHDEHGPIPCSPKGRDGCGCPQLSLKRTGMTDIRHLSQNVEKAMKETFPELGICHSCFDAPSCDRKHKNLCLSTNRNDSTDNYLFCPSTPMLEKHSLEHFQKHWLQGEPVIVRNVLKSTSGLSWDPSDIFHAVGENISDTIEGEAKNVQTLDCLNWRQVAVCVIWFFYSEENIKMISS